MEQNLTLKTIDGYSISAMHTISKGRGVILWLHGITVNKDEYLDFFRDGVKYLGDKGFDSLRFDFRGHGESSGSSLDFSIAGQMLDVEAALKYISENYYANKTPLHIVGCSFGAPPAIFSALNNQNLVKGIVLISPILSYERTFLKPETEWAQSIFNPNTLSEVKKTNKLFIEEDFPVSAQLIEEMKLIKPEDVVNKLKQDVVIIHGDADSMIPFDVSKEIANKSKNVKFFSIPGMDHGFMDECDEEGIGEQSLKNKQQIYDIILGHCS